MASARKVSWAFASVKVEYLSLNSSIGYSKEMSSITELNFSAPFNLQTLELMKRFRKQIQKNDFVLNCNNDVETTWVECNC
jgi:hypothetical protein